ncbi:hypothetical protein AHAS_Ahas14G0181400 [Arachis hypogaea]
MDREEEAQSRRTLGSYTVLTSDFYRSSISIPPIGVAHFELNPQLITPVQQNCQFQGLSQEEPVEFLADFLQYADTVYTNGVDQEVYKLLLFSFTVKGQAKRYKMMLRKCPTKIISKWVKLDIFYYGLTDMAKMSLDHSASGSIHMKKTIEEAHTLIETVFNNQHLYSSNETPIKGEVKTVSTESDPPEQSKSLTQ